MARNKTENGEEPLELKLTSMIDVVFQLLIFFLVVTKFPEPESILKSWLPKDQGLHTTTPRLDLEDVRLVLRMSAQSTKEEPKLTCQFPDINSPTGFRNFETALLKDWKSGIIERVPIWSKVTTYLREKKQNYRETGQGTKGLPVILDFDKDVPFKHVATALDICAELKILNLQIAAPELKSLTTSK